MLHSMHPYVKYNLYHLLNYQQRTETEIENFDQDEKKFILVDVEMKS